MNWWRLVCCCLVLGGGVTAGAQDFLDRADEALSVSWWQDQFRARLSGTLDLEFYHFQQPAPGLINSTEDNLFNPRLSLFLDGQWQSQFYGFVQVRVDRGFDPSDGGANIRLDEYAVRYTPWEDGRFTFQIGKFATVVGTFVSRHLSWDNPFVNAPLPYENVTGVEDKAAPISGADFIQPFLPRDKYEYNPVIWGPNYASGLSVSGRVAQFEYAAEMKNAALSSRPESWDVTAVGFDNPTFSGRLGYRPSPMWSFGFSASNGAYMRDEADITLPPNRSIGDYHESVLGQDISFAWHHLQVWAEVFEAQFQIPRVGNADTLAYYIEAKYKLTPQLFAALRWNEQFFGTVRTGEGHRAPWGSDLGRIDAALAYRFTAHTQLKLQYSWQKETSGQLDDNHLVAAQFTVRF
ncbi:MAG TPA: hypothetical protein VGG94_01755 [Chthoniobacterales bacterium]